MKTTIYLILILFLPLLFSCNQEEKPGSDTGVLRIGVLTDTSVITKADERVDTGTIKLRIRKIGTEVVTEYDYEAGFAPIEVPPGSYELTATSGHSNGGKAGFDTPYYMGRDTVSVTSGNEATAHIVCTLTTVKITVKYASGVSAYFKDGFKAVVRNESGELTYEKEDEAKAGYFAPGNLSVDFVYYNKTTSQWVTLSQEGITDAKARYSYTIQFDMKSEEGDESSEGAANIEITTGDETNGKQVEIGIDLPQVAIATLPAENIAAATATLKGCYTSPSGKEPSAPFFYYRVKNAPDWIKTQKATLSNGIFTYELTGLQQGLEYEYRFMEKGNVLAFTTLQNGITLETKAVGLNTVQVYGRLMNSKSKIYFEYKTASASNWIKVDADSYGSDLYGAVLSGLTPNTSYQYRFIDSQEKTVHTLQTVQVKITPWAKLAIMDCEVVPEPTETDTVLIQYDLDGGSKVIRASKANNKLYAVIEKLQSNTNYHIVVGNNSLNFKTEEEALLPYANFDSWAQYSGTYKFMGFIQKTYKTWYVGSQEDANNKNAFWDSGNYGTSADLASVAGYKNPTYPEPGSRPGGSGTQVACLKSQYVGLGGSAGQFAAGNLYIGKFGEVVGTSGAKLNFGRKWNTHPTALEGWYKYSPGKIDYQGKNGPQDVKDTQDLCSIFIVLIHADTPASKDFYHLMNNTDLSTFIDFSSANKDIIAYGELPTDRCHGNDWEKFNIPLIYRDLSATPTHILIVASASKYGDYFTGSTSSIMYLDDFELIYGESLSPNATN